jgi:hypothetical protein
MHFLVDKYWKIQVFSMHEISIYMHTNDYNAHEIICMHPHAYYLHESKGYKRNMT